jgi:hypothetical protein
MLFCIIGCSDTPYTGSMLQPGDVDKYIFLHGDGRICLSNGVDSACVTLVPKRKDSAAPIIHIYPKRIVYVFYHEGVPILRAERETETSDIIKEITGGPGTPPGGAGSGVGPRDEGSGQQLGNIGSGDNNGGGGGDNGDGNNNGGNNPGGNNPGGNNPGGNNPDTNNPNTPNPSGHNPPDNVLSHLVEDSSRNGWIVWVYYPHNYVAEGHPRGLGMDPIDPQTGPASVDDPITNYRDDYGFTMRMTGGEIKNFSQTSGPCTDELIGPPPPLGDFFVSEDNRQAGKDNRDDHNDTPCGASGSDYSVQFFVKSTADSITITIRWTHGMYAPQTQTFNIMKEVSIRDYDANPPQDPGHTHQHGW